MNKFADKIILKGMSFLFKSPELEKHFSDSDKKKAFLFLFTTIGLLLLSVISIILFTINDFFFGIMLIIAGLLLFSLAAFFYYLGKVFAQNYSFPLLIIITGLSLPLGIIPPAIMVLIGAYFGEKKKIESERKITHALSLLLWILAIIAIIAAIFERANKKKKKR